MAAFTADYIEPINSQWLRGGGGGGGGGSEL